jgi:hypothetical protein
MNTTRKRVGRAGSLLTLALATFALAGCDDLLEVDLPAQLGDDAINDPAGAETQINSMIAHFENGYDQWVWQAFGREDGGESMVCSGGYSHCDYFTYNPTMGEFSDFAKSRSFAMGLYDKLDKEWTVAQVGQRDRFMAISAIYAGANLNIMGSSLCEVTVNAGPLLTPTQTLTLAEEWLTKALTHIQTAGGTAGDFAMPHGIASSAKSMAYGLRAQVRWMKGDLTGAAADAALVPGPSAAAPQGFRAFVIREATPDRRNRPYYAGTVTRYVELADVNDWWKGGTAVNPATGSAYPTPIPFTGYRDLGILPDGRAVRDDGLPIRIAGNHRTPVESTAVKDTRVQHTMGVVFARSAQTYVTAKYSSEADDEPLVTWREMVLIRAEAAAATNPQGAIDLVNTLRTAENLPRITYITGATATPLQIRQMLIEERRRALYLEGRFLFTKFKNPDLLWFPRSVGQSRDAGHAFTGGVRWLMPDSEYQLNTNLGMEKRGTGCTALERPVNF